MEQDEATASLDANTEFAVQEALQRLMVGRTVLVIAHRLSTIKNANKVCVIEGGKVVEEGSHNDLMKQENGRYRELVQKQVFTEETE